MYFLPRYRRGIRNRYRKGMPVSEMMIKDLSHAFRAVRNYFKNKFRTRSILVYPHFPSSGSTLYRISKILSYNITNRPDKHFDVAVYWEYLTHRKEYQVPEEISRSKRVVNLYSRDISKEYVDRKFRKVFGYSTVVDPLSHSGSLVKKNDANARHDGQVLTGPLKENEEGFIYQILIDNTFGEDLVMDIRVPVVGGLLDFVYLKYRSVHERFKNTTVRVELVKTQDILRDDEIELLGRFCREIHLEYGELDVLRDNADKRIYVVDVNNTPQGPPANTSARDRKKALYGISKRFREIFLEEFPHPFINPE